MARVVWVVALISCLAGARAAADPLRVRGACNGALVETHLAALMGRDPFAGGANPLAVEIDVGRAPGRIEARVQIGGAERRIAAATCGELADAIAVVIAIALREADAAAREAPPPLDAASIDAISPATAVRVVELPAPPVLPEAAHAPARTRTAAALPEAPLAIDEPPPRPPARSAHLTAMYSIGNANALRSQRLAAGAALRRGRFSLGAEVRYDWLASYDVDVHGHFAATRAALALAPCAYLGPVSACALAEASRTRGELTGSAPMTSHALDVSAGGRLAVDYAFIDHASLRVQLDLEAPFTTSHFPLVDGSVWANARVEIWLAAGIDAHFP